MNSKVTIYFETLLKPEKNYAFDMNGHNLGIEHALSDYDHQILDYQYVKQGLNITIKVDLQQENLNMHSVDMNYVKIQNGYGEDNEEPPCYYFVTRKVWKSKNTIELVLTMDTLNSFRYNLDYVLNHKTLVYREHKDRLQGIDFGVGDDGYIKLDDASWGYFYTDLYIQMGMVTNVDDIDFQYVKGYMENTLEDDPNFSLTGYGFSMINNIPYLHLYGQHTAGQLVHIRIIYDNTKHLSIRKIHKNSEDILAPKRKVKGELLYDSYQFSWDLLYRNANIPDDTNIYNNPVDTYLIPENPLSIKIPSTSGSIGSGQLDNGEYMLFFYEYDPATISFNGSLYTPSQRITSSYGYHSHQENAYALMNDNGTFRLYSGSFYEYSGGDQSGVGGQWTEIGTASGSITISNIATIHVRKENSLPTASAIFTNKIYLGTNTNSTITLSTNTTKVVNSSTTIDKTDSRNIKLLKLPYAPCDIEVDSYGVVTPPPSWKFDTLIGLLKLEDNNLKFVHKVKPITEMSFLTQTLVELGSLNDSKDIKYESKLFHSDFYNPKFTYDSFWKNFDLERINMNDAFASEIKNAYIEFNFVVSRNIVSKFLFEFPQYSSEYVEEIQDFNNILCVARNNEEVLYNSQYLNYLRTGYNYDLKTKERTEVASGVGIGLNIASLVASIGIGAVTGNAIAIGSAVASTISLAGQLVSYAKTTAQNDQNIAQKLQETQMQAVSVLNADDCDLLDYYCDNKAMFSIYEVSEEMKNALFDLFYYCGYKINRQYVPDNQTRYWFNFIQADVVFEDTCNMNADIEEDIKAKFKDGVTFFHYHNKFELTQTKENWETAVVPYLQEE